MPPIDSRVRAAPIDRSARTVPIEVRDRPLPPWLIGGAIVFGIVVRVLVMRGPLGGIDSDEGVSALVSRKIWHGHFYAFIPGLQAGGTLLAYPRALVLAITGPNAAAAKWCEIVVFAAACVVVWRVGRRLFSERHGEIAALLMWIYPAATVWDSTKVRLYYTVALLFVALGMLVALRLYDAAEPAVADLAAFGAIGGVCVWTHPMALYAFVPTTLWLFSRRPALLRRLPLIAGAGLLTALPWLWHNVDHDWELLHQPPPPLQSTLKSRFEGFFRGLLPRLTGMRHFYNGPWFLSPWSKILYFALGAIAVVALLRWRGKRTLLTAVAVGYPLLFAIPRNSAFVAEARYGIPFVPVLALCAAALVMWLTRANVIGVAAVIVLAAIVTAVSLQRVVDTTAASSVRPWVLWPVPTGPVWTTIEQRRLTAVYADYWLAYRLVFEDRTDVVVIPLTSDYYHIGDHNQSGAADAFFYRDSGCLAGWLDVVHGMGITTTTEPIGDYVLVHTPSAIALPQFGGAMNGRC